MKSLEQIKELFVSARELVKVASPDSVDVVIEKITEISNHCKELYEIETSYIERAKCINMYTSLDNIIKILSVKGFIDERIGAFFGLGNSDTLHSPSFGELSQGKGTIKAPVFDEKSNPNIKHESPFNGIGEGDEKKESPAKNDDLPPPPKGNSEFSESETPNPIDIEGKEPSPIDGNDDHIGSGNNIVSGTDSEPQFLHEFIGQEQAVTQLKKEIAASKILGKKSIDHVLLLGNKGLGKTTLMKIIANELGVEFKYINASALTSDSSARKYFFEWLIGIALKKKPVVIGIDEVHMLSENLQTSLYTLLSSNEFTHVSKTGVETYKIPEFTFIGATTEPNLINEPFKDRCKNLTLTLEDYSREELRKIVVNKFVYKNLSIEENAINCCINRCRSSIRELTAIVKGVHTSALLSQTKIVTAEMIEEYFSLKKIDAIGLSKKEIELLNIIKNEPSGVISEETLAARLNTNVKILKKDYETYLIKIGFLVIHSRGRSLTEKAKNYLQYGYFDFGDNVTIGSLPSDE